MKKIILISLAILPSALLASASLQESDFIQRVINFVIFIAILWYFAFDTIKGIFTQRQAEISRRLQEAQDLFHKAKKEQEMTNKRLEESKEKAKEIVNMAKQEAYIIEQKYNEQIKKDLENLKYSLESNMNFERTKAIQNAVTKALNQLMQSKSAQLHKQDYINIITKRIS